MTPAYRLDRGGRDIRFMNKEKLIAVKKYTFIIDKIPGKLPLNDAGIALNIFATVL
jgi:hypothetical protein